MIHAIYMCLILFNNNDNRVITTVIIGNLPQLGIACVHGYYNDLTLVTLSTIIFTIFAMVVSFVNYCKYQCFEPGVARENPDVKVTNKQASLDPTIV